MVILSYPKTRFPEIKSNAEKAHRQKNCWYIGNYTETIPFISLSKYFKMKNYLKRMIGP
jgi:hypothetical protein